MPHAEKYKSCPYLKPLESSIIWIKQQASKCDQLSCPIPSITTQTKRTLVPKEMTKKFRKTTLANRRE